MAMRISGLASGLDIDSMVQVLMQPQQTKIDNLFRKKELWGWKQDAYNSVNAKLARFVLDRKTDFGISSTSNGVTYDKSRTSVTWLKTATVSNSSSSSTNVLTATAATTAADGNYKVNVKQVADNWSAASEATIEQANKTDDNGVALVNSLNNMFDLKDGDTVDFTIETNKGKLKVTSAKLSDDEKAQLTKDGVKLVEIDLAATTLSNVASSITSAGIGVSASFDSNTGRFFMQTAQTGESNWVKFYENSTYADGTSMDFIAGSGKDGKGNLLKLQHEVKQTDSNGNTVTNMAYVMSSRNFVATSDSAVANPSESNIRAQLGIDAGNTLNVTIKDANGKEVIITNNSKNNTDGYIFVDINKASLSDLADKINEAVKDGKISGISASFENGKFSLDTSESMTIIDNSKMSSPGNASNKVGFLTGENGSLLQLRASGGDLIENNEEYSPIDGYKGQDAIIDFGVAKDIKQSSNDFTINGVNLSIKNVGQTEVQVATDVTSAIDKIKQFVNEYNKFVTDLNSLLKEKNDKSYQPLLDVEKKEMSADQITAWENKGKTGLLRNDNAITTMLNNIRNDIFEPVTGVREDMNALYKIGITFDSYSTTAGGQLTIDEDKLREALLKDGNAVIDVLFKTQDNSISTDKKANMEQSGAFTRMTMDIVDGMKSIINIAGTGNNETLYRSVNTGIMLDYFTKHSGVSDLQKEINTFTNSMTDLNAKFTRMQENYYKRYTALETAVSNANMQSGWLSAQFSS